MTQEQVDELLSLCRAILGELGRLNDCCDRILASKPLPPKRGGK